RSKPWPTLAAGSRKDWPGSRFAAKVALYDADTVVGCARTAGGQTSRLKCGRDCAASGGGCWHKEAFVGLHLYRPLNFRQLFKALVAVVRSDVQNSRAYRHGP